MYMNIFQSRFRVCTSTHIRKRMREHDTSNDKYVYIHAHVRVWLRLS